MGDGKPVNYKDLALKVFWTGVATALALAVVLVSDAEVTGDVWWALPAVGVINAALAWVRQRVGATPPEAPNTNTSVLR
jgi:hypothetical protein